MATIRNIGIPAGEGLLFPYVRDPRSFMDKDTLEINWDEVRVYFKKHQDYWKNIPVEYREAHIDDIC